METALLRHSCRPYHLGAICAGFIRFFLRPVLAFGYFRCMRLSVCVSVYSCALCVNPHLFRAITWEPLEQRSPNLEQRCKTPLLSEVCVRLALTSKTKSTFNVKSPFCPNLPPGKLHKQQQ